jgi:Ras-related protein Rab-7A
MFDVHQPETLEALKKWWAEFCLGAPLAEEDYLEHPCFIVGNKIDLEVTQDQSTPDRVSLSHLHKFVGELMPVEEEAPPQTQKSPSIHIQPQSSPVEHGGRKSPNWSHSSPPITDKFNSLSSLNTATSLYHTPSSSLFSDIFHTARSSPEPVPSSIPPSTSIPSAPGAPLIARARRLTLNSTRSGSSASVVTMTPSLFAREQQESVAGNSSYGTTLTTPEDGTIPGSSGQPPPPPERGPSLHFTSAKTGEGVRALFEHVAARVIRKVEYEEYFEARRMHFREGSLVETVRLGVDGQSQTGRLGNLARPNCC